MPIRQNAAALANRTFQPGIYEISPFVLNVGEYEFIARIDYSQFIDNSGNPEVANIIFQPYLSLDNGVTWDVWGGFADNALLLGETRYDEDGNEILENINQTSLPDINNPSRQMKATLTVNISQLKTGITIDVLS